jgi:hypothetical protein
MSNEQSRTDANSRERSPDHEYTLSIEETADLYAKAGHPRTPRAIQKYCAVSKLDCRKAETETGEKYLVAPYSVERHIAYINELRTVANSRDQSRTDANVRALENKDEPSPEQQRTAPKGREQPRMDPNVRAPDERYLERLESENHFLREQISVKDGQIALKDKTIDALLERDRETNILIAGLQKMLALPGGREPHTAE